MESIQQIFQSQLGKNLNQGEQSFEKQEYILTAEEEENALLYAFEQETKSLRFKLKSFGMIDSEIENKIEFEFKLDREKILERANSNKHHAEWEKECRNLEKKQELEKKELLKKEWTASALFQYLKHIAEVRFNTSLIADEHTLKIIKTLCFFISEDIRFETELGYSLKKGILFMGKAGVGKTFIPKCLSGNSLRPIFLVNIIEITDVVKESGLYESPKKDGILYIDDIGTEESPILRYGTPVNWFKEFIEKYHFNNLPFNKLVISTNLDAEEIENKYGYRVRSRMREMFNTVELQAGNDLRK